MGVFPLFLETSKYIFFEGSFSSQPCQFTRGYPSESFCRAIIWLVVFSHPSEKYAQVKLDHFPQVGVKINHIWNHHLVHLIIFWKKTCFLSMDLSSTIPGDYYFNGRLDLQGHGSVSVLKASFKITFSLRKTTGWFRWMSYFQRLYTVSFREWRGWVFAGSLNGNFMENGVKLTRFLGPYLIVGFFPPIWKICSSNWTSSPNRGENKNIWNHHLNILLTLFFFYCTPKTYLGNYGKKTLRIRSVVTLDDGRRPAPM